MIELFKQQIHVVQSTIFNFNKTVTDLNDNKLIFDENFSKLQKFMAELKSNHFNLELKQTIDEQFSLLTFMLSELENEYSTIVDSMLFSKSNSIHPLIITPNQLIAELAKTLPFLPSYSTYVLPLDQVNAYKIYDNVKVKSYFNQNRIIYVFSNRLINSQRYNLYNLIPLPILKDTHTMLFILPSINYLALSDDKNTYTTLKSHTECKTVQKDRLICPLINPIYNVHTRSICETQLLSKINFNFNYSLCDTRISSTDLEIWHKLETSNSWLYVLPKLTDITINCSSHNLINMVLNQTGVITLDKNCKLFTSTTTLISEPINFESAYQAIVPDFEIKLEDCCEKQIKEDVTVNLTLTPLRATNLNKEDLNLVSKKIN